MTDFKSGGVPNPDYDSEDINFVNQKTEFTDDVYVYGKLYADFGGDVQTFSTAGVERVRITSTGVVSINQNNPTSGAKLEVESEQLGGTAGNTQEVVRLHSPDVSNNTSYRFTNYRHTNGTSHTSSELRFRRHVDATDMGYFGLGDGYASIGYGTAEKLRITSDGKVGIGSAIPTSGLQVNNFFRSQLEPPSLSQPLGANWATESAIVTKGDFGGGICLDDNGIAGYSIFTSGNGNNLHIRAGLVGQVPAEKLLINSDSATDGKIKSLCQVVFYNVTQTQRDALTAQTGGVIYNTSTNKLQCWNGSSWNNLF